MVDPISAAERSTFNRRLKAGVTGLVGASAGLIALQIDATLPQTAGAVALGLVIGYLMARFVVPSGPSPADRQRARRARENPFEDDEDGTDGGTDRPGDDGNGDDDSDRTRSRSSDRGRR
ncbi:hypothetical protein [Halosimplex salinum]|uniref:hypothetical protein n=1 Tax=Halosimplex salinum TaxID=1710538 RepID=UPI000F468CA1|nr:hypothetical protein [Halosimplex salinum]